MAKGKSVKNENHKRSSEDIQKISIGTSVFQLTVPEGCKGTDLGIVSAYLGNKQYEITWDNGEKISYSESDTARMAMHWEVTYA